MLIDIDCIGSCKSNYHAITTTMAPDYIGTLFFVGVNFAVKDLLFIEYLFLLFYCL